MAELFASKPRRRNGVMRASHRDANEGFEANSQQAPPFVNFYPLPAFPSLVFINTGNGIKQLDL